MYVEEFIMQIKVSISRKKIIVADLQNVWFGVGLLHHERYSGYIVKRGIGLDVQSVQVIFLTLSGL